MDLSREKEHRENNRNSNNLLYSVNRKRKNIGFVR